MALYDAQYRPKVSGIVLSFILLLLVTFISNLFGAHPHSSFWSNLERMDGYISLVHTFMYMLVLGSVLQGKQIWNWLFNISLSIAVLVSFYGLAQFATEESRITSTLGNAGFLAIYMLFHIFFAFLLFVESTKISEKIIYASIIPLFTFVLFETGTRGTFIGLIVGVIVMSAYIAILNAQSLNYRKFAIGASVLLLAGVSTFIAIKDSNVIQNDTSLARIANISSEDLNSRIIIWSVAWEGIKEKPFLGYGQDNFNYVYNKHYDPRLYNTHRLDRAHNIIFAWLITGGFLGLVIYLSIFAWCIWYLLLRPIINKEDDPFNKLERGVLLGILSAYFTQSIVTFDTVISYIFFAITLAFITSKVGAVPEKMSRFKIEPVWITRLATPVIILLLVSIVYFLYVPAMIAAMEIKNAYHESNPFKRIKAYERAIKQHSFHQKITEMLAVHETPKVVNSSILSNEIKQQFYVTTEQEIEKLISENPNDAHIHMTAGIFYYNIEQYKKAVLQMNLARKFSPMNQLIIHYQGVFALKEYNVQQSYEFFKTAFELNEEYLQAREDYAASLLILHKLTDAIALMNSDEARDKFANSPHLIDTAERYGQIEFLSKLYAHRVYAKSNEEYRWNKDPMNWAQLAYLYYKLGKHDEALVVLKDARKKLPSVEIIFNCYISSIEDKRDPKSDCPL